jgi:hypothetical protein
MKRRDFMGASLAAGAATLGSAVAQPTGDGRQYIEILRYHTAGNGKKGTLNNYFKDAFIPAMNRLGVKNVGVASPQFGDAGNSFYVMLPHESLESWGTWRSRLLEDRTYLSAAKEVVEAPFDAPAYSRIEGWLLHAFKECPTLEIPAQGPRLFEMRIYRSHSMTQSQKKIHMFNEGGEIQIFRDNRLKPVFFGEMISGPEMPSLVYMVVHKDGRDREDNWDAFRKAPAWEALRQKSMYKNTVTSITDIVMRPAGYSQV